MPDKVTRHIPALDGLRGIAILLVLGWHYIPGMHWFFPGWAGVDLFFVLSGYLITAKLLATRGRPNYFLNFYRNRALRILPLYYTVFIVFLAVIHLFVQKQHLTEFSIYTSHWKSFLLFMENWTFIFVGLPKNASLVHFWSIAIEEQFYLIWPVVILLHLSPESRIKLFAWLIIFGMLTRTAFYLRYPALYTLDHFNTIFRADSLIAGALLCQLHQAGSKVNTALAKRIALLLLILIAAGSLIAKNADIDNPFYGTIGYTLVAIFFACILHLIVIPGSRALTNLFLSPFLRYCGKISYGVYILHLPILHFAGTKMIVLGTARWPGNAGLVYFIAISVCLAVTFLLSAVSFRYFESWFLSFKTRVPQT